MYLISVTAGVLRGLKSRFECFGDTINTASRMESTGARDKIQISKETAELLIEDGLESWVEPREDLVHAKGKGCLQTYWLEIPDDNNDCTLANVNSVAKSHPNFDQFMDYDSEFSNDDECESSKLVPRDENDRKPVDIEEGSTLCKHSSSSSIFVGDSTNKKI